MQTPGLPWHRGCGYPVNDQGAPVESTRDFTAFQHYLKLGRTRSNNAVATVDGRTRQRIDQISKRYCWRARAEAYDDHELTLHAQDVLARKTSVPQPEAVPGPYTAALVVAATNSRDHLDKLVQFRATSEQLGAQQLELAGKVLARLQGDVEQLENGTIARLPADFDRLLRAATAAAAAGHKMVAEALGVEELALLIEEALNEKDARITADAEPPPDAVTVEVRDAD